MSLSKEMEFSLYNNCHITYIYIANTNNTFYGKTLSQSNVLSMLYKKSLANACSNMI